MPSREALLAAVALALLQPSAGHPRAPAPVFRERGATELPVGRWTVRFANGVVEECRIGRDGSVGLVEPGRAAGGRARVDRRAVVIVYEDDRIERWTTAGPRMTVEHWFPATRYPSGAPVLGEAVRAR